MNKKQMNIFLIIYVLISIPIGLWLSSIHRTKVKTIESNGLKGVGCVIHKGYSKNARLLPDYTIKFDFELGDTIIVAVNTLLPADYFNNAIIGMKYEIRYLPESPHKDAIIYIDKPVKSEYLNIPNERERIMNTYKISKEKLQRFDVNTTYRK